ncbi:hypothetical protein ABKA04_009343 [Annulohypoxylon sp. FPYF3050]
MATSQKGTIIVTGANRYLGSDITWRAYLESGKWPRLGINERVSAQTIPRIRGLVLNAAFIEYETQTWAEEGGFDMAFVSNYLGHWLLTLMLLQSMDLENGRITMVSSDSHNPDDWLTGVLGTFKHPDDKWRPFIAGENIDHLAFGTWSSRAEGPDPRGGMRRYGAAKFCLVTMVSELQRRLNSDPVLNQVTMVGVDPGMMPSADGVARRLNWFLYPQYDAKIRTSARSARDIMRGVMDVSLPKAAYIDGTTLTETGLEAQDVKKWEMIWHDSVRYTQLKEDETAPKEWK